MIRYAFFFGLLLLASVAFVLLLWGYFEPIFWAAALAVTFYPVERHLNNALKGRRSIAAFLTVLLILATVIVPALFTAAAVVREAATLYGQIQSGEIDFEGPLRWVQSMLPMADELSARVGVDLAQIKEQLSGAAVKLSQLIASQAFSVGQDALRFGIKFVVMLYLLFFFLRDGAAIIDAVVRILPIGDERERALLAKFAEVSRATIKGTLVVGLVQGVMGGVLFAVLGIKAAVLWGVVMTILSILPVVGASLVWLPAAIAFIADGDVVSGTVLIVFGAVVIGLADNILRPLLVGRDTKMPDYLILLSTLGGLSMFGVSGFVIGPVIAALFLATWSMFEAEFKEIL